MSIGPFDTPTPDERFDNLYSVARWKGLLAGLTADLGNQATIGEARRMFRALDDCAGWKKLDRLRIELKYLDPMEWDAFPLLSASADVLPTERTHR